MSETTSRLGLPFIMPAQAQKHVTHNEALQRLDALVHLVISGTAFAPPPAPAEGACHIVGPGASGAFTGHEGEIAIFQDGYFQFIAPVAGWSAWFSSAGEMRVFDGASWIAAALPSDAGFQTVGVNAGADFDNRLAVSAPATLLTHAGAGHQLKINKATTGDTASLLFQSGWSGRAEMGLAGSDGFAIKTSPDGVTWHEALKVLPSGAVVAPQRPLVRAALAAGLTAIATPSSRGFDTLYVEQGGYGLGAAVSGGGQSLVFPVSGYYMIMLNVAASATGAYSVTLEKNGTENVAIVRGSATGGTECSSSTSALAYFSAGDTARLTFSGSATYNLGYGATELVAILA